MFIRPSGGKTGRGKRVAVHMSDALLSPAVGGAMWAAAAATVAVCARRLRQRPDDRRVALMGVLGAFLFTAQMTITG